MPSGSGPVRPVRRLMMSVAMLGGGMTGEGRRGRAGADRWRVGLVWERAPGAGELGCVRRAARLTTARCAPWRARCMLRPVRSVGRRRRSTARCAGPERAGVRPLCATASVRCCMRLPQRSQSSRGSHAEFPVTSGPGITCPRGGRDTPGPEETARDRCFGRVVSRTSHSCLQTLNAATRARSGCGEVSRSSSFRVTQLCRLGSSLVFHSPAPASLM